MGTGSVDIYFISQRGFQFRTGEEFRELTASHLLGMATSLTGGHRAQTPECSDIPKLFPRNSRAVFTLKGKARVAAPAPLPALRAPLGHQARAVLLGYESEKTHFIFGHQEAQMHLPSS